MHGSARPAEADDLEQLTHLLHLAIERTPSARGGQLFGRPQRNVDVTDRARSAMSATDHMLAAGTIDDAIFGVAIASIAGGLVTIEELHVDREARDVGVGESLLELIVEWAGKQGAYAIDYPALPGDRATKNLGERSGFSARLILMHRRL